MRIISGYLLLLQIIGISTGLAKSSHSYLNNMTDEMEGLKVLVDKKYPNYRLNFMYD